MMWLALILEWILINELSEKYINELVIYKKIPLNYIYREENHLILFD